MKKTLIVLTGTIIISTAAFAFNGRGLNRTDNCDYNMNEMRLGGQRIHQSATGYGKHSDSKGRKNGTGRRNKGQKRQTRAFFNDSEFREAALSKYDTDRNGSLSTDELRIMREHHAELRDKFDSDDDGRLSDEEYSNFRKAVREELGL